MTGLAENMKGRPRRRAFFALIWDKLGIVVSGLCLVDCLVLPLLSALLISLQSSVSWFANLHFYLLPVIGVTASMAFHHSYKAHRSYGIVIMGAVGYVLLVLGEVFEAKLRFFLFNWVTLLGSALLIAAHLRNLLMHTGHRHKHAHPAGHAQSAHVP
ncbi:MAG TPA: MerC domain-containing protein [Turneriella sp.]|nr:MerC domain-containing protein [Turneriella sp.]HNL54168.1 MerC domain-containing protein [Turneriella sp.]HNM99379.1 MerC domain-containing protein [Turneriella sp.]